jgi:hypothetical protein
MIDVEDDMILASTILKIVALLAAQFIDANSTTHLVQIHGRELNPIMKPFAGHTMSMMGAMMAVDVIQLQVVGPKHRDAALGAEIASHVFFAIRNNNLTRHYTWTPPSVAIPPSTEPRKPIP